MCQMIEGCKFFCFSVSQFWEVFKGATFHQSGARVRAAGMTKCDLLSLVTPTL